MHIQQALLILELPLNSFKIPNGASYNLAVEKMNEFKELIKKQRKKLAKKYHPDVSEIDSSEKFKLINNVADQLLKLDIKPAQRRPVFRTVVHVYRSENEFHNDSTTTSFNLNDMFNNFHRY
jgi:DnaJ-class molecular chaperone